MKAWHVTKYGASESCISALSEEVGLKFRTRKPHLFTNNRSLLPLKPQGEASGNVTRYVTHALTALTWEGILRDESSAWPGWVQWTLLSRPKLAFNKLMLGTHGNFHRASGLLFGW